MQDSITRGFALVGLVILLGCTPAGPELGSVSGIITMDREPVEGAYVTYLPLFAGGIELNCAQKTDATGHYEMQFSVDRNGVMLGEHRVLVSTLDDIKLTTGANQKIPERIPRIYVNEKSPLLLDVKAGKNDGSFDLSSKPESK